MREYWPKKPQPLRIQIQLRSNLKYNLIEFIKSNYIPGNPATYYFWHFGKYKDSFRRLEFINEITKLCLN